MPALPGEALPGEARASTGWETMLAGLIRAGFTIDGTWPMRTELITALKRSVSALASSIVLVCRPRPEDAPITDRRAFLSALKRELPRALRELRSGGIAPVDFAQAAIGPGMAVYSRYAKVLEADGSAMSVRTALALINATLDEVLAEAEGDLDPDSRWAVAWFEQHGFEEGAYGDAETLCKAKNTSAEGLVEAGILHSRAGKVRLLRRDELGAPPSGWQALGAGKDAGAPSGTPVVWAVTQHLVRALDGGEAAAAALLAKLGGVGETARDLAYRLYGICERKGWAAEALGYNALVTAWSGVRQQAADLPRPTVQGELELE